MIILKLLDLIWMPPLGDNCLEHGYRCSPSLEKFPYLRQDVPPTTAGLWPKRKQAFPAVCSKRRKEGLKTGLWDCSLPGFLLWARRLSDHTSREKETTGQARPLSGK